MKQRLPWIIGAVVAVLVAVFAIVAVTGTSDEDRSAAGVVSEFQDVDVSGESLAAFTGQGTDPALGVVAPVLRGAGPTGNVVTTEPGAPTLLVFLAHWCPVCQREVPVLVNWFNDGMVPDNLDVIAVTTSSDPASPNFPPSAWLANEKWPAVWPIMADSGANDAANAFGLNAFPYFTLVGSDGRVLWRHSGEIDSTTLTLALTTALAGN
ncbi:MAG: TlpA family protein disulfide reductase [Ilumatobacteraceae bacterium]